MQRILAAALLNLAALAPSHAGDAWPGWRGPTGQGVTDEKDFPLVWGGEKARNVLWKVLLPGAGGPHRLDRNQSSPIVWKDRVFVTAAYWPSGTAQSEFAEHHVACYSVEDGRRHWDVRVKPGPWRLQDLRGGYCAPTPATDGERVYCLFGSSVLAAVDFDGKLVWRKEIAPYAWDVAIGTSPFVFKETVLVLADGTKPENSRLIAFDKRSGETAWVRPRPTSNFNHSTPLLIEVGHKAMLVVASSAALQGVDPGDGRVRWWAKVKGDVPTPAFANGLIYTEDGRGGPAAAVDPTGAGDVAATHVKWRTRPIPEGYCSPTIVGDYVYRTHNPGVLQCIRLSNGEVVYNKRLPAGVELAASPISTSDKSLLFASGGKSLAVRTGPKFEIVAANDLNDAGPASPAAANGRLFIKGAEHLFCIGKKETERRGDENRKGGDR